MNHNKNEISEKMLQRFCRDCNLPINIYRMRYFIDRLALYDPFYHCIEKYKRFQEELNGYATEQDYFAEYNRVKDNAILDIKSNEAYQRFNTLDMNQFAVTHQGLPSKDIYKPCNNGKTFLSIDIQKANFTALRHYDPKIFGNADTWVQFLIRYTQSQHILESKYIRQVILGNCNPKRHIAYEKHLMDQILNELLKNIDESKVAFFSNDEIVLDISHLTPDEQQNLHIQYSYEHAQSKLANIPLHIERFRLYTINQNNNTVGYLKEKSYGTIEIKGVNPYLLPFVICAINHKRPDECDRTFVHEGILSQFIEIPEITISENQKRGQK